MNSFCRLLSAALLAAFLMPACTRQEMPPEPTPAPQPEPEPEPEPEPVLLKGTVIGTQTSVDYATGSSSMLVNTRAMAFDGKFDTFFASYDRSGTWVGLDLGEPHIITKVGCAPRSTQESRVVLALFEGADKADFSDALPLAIVKKKGTAGKLSYIDVDCSRAFRYVRYVGPHDARCNVAEVEFYGYKAAGDDTRLPRLTNLPAVVINTAKAQAITSKETYVPANIYILSDEGLLDCTGSEIKGRGNASWDFPKKPYKMKFAEKQHVLGSPAKDKKWTLINNYGDKTLMRNILAFEVSRRAGMAYTPFCKPVDVIVNGEYQGCYQLCDQVEAGKGRVPAKDGYLIEIDAYATSEDVYFYSSKGTPVTVKHPDSEAITQEQLAFIKKFYGSTETALFSNTFSAPESGYRKYMDLDSFLRNFIVGEFCGNTDTYWSMYMYKDAADGPFFTGPVWDYDLAFENDNRTHPINNLSDYIYAYAGSVASDSAREMVNRIVKQDPAAKARLVALWEEVKPQLSTLNNYVTETASLLDESQQLNFLRWPILNQYVHQNFQATGSYSAEVNTVKQYITARLSRLDQLIRR